MRGYRFVTFFGDLPKFKDIMALSNFCYTQDHMGLETSKRYSSYSFYPIWPKLYHKLDSHKGYKVINVLAKFVALWWHFNMGVNGKILKGTISWKRLIICGVFLLPHSFNLIWGHSVHFTTALWIFVNTEPYGLEVSKRYSSHSFYPIWAKLYDKECRECKFINVSVICQKLKILWALKFLHGSQWGKFEHVQYLEKGWS